MENPFLVVWPLLLKQPMIETVCDQGKHGLHRKELNEPPYNGAIGR
jgi:hypothetical protein